MTRLGTEKNPLLVAIVGSGPSGFYAAEGLLKSNIYVKIDVFERLPSPYGLVRSGVAPDHQKLKRAITLYEKIADNDNFNLIANVTVGRDIMIDELKQSYHAIIITCGTETDRKLGIHNEELKGSHTATEFVGWYNGHPDYRDRTFDLSHNVAVIIGQGNVAADVGRILSKTVDELKYTDIAQHALDALAESKIKKIYIIGRRGPAQAKFTPKELREFGELSDCNSVVLEEELILNPESTIELDEKRNIANKKIYNLFCEFKKHKIDSTKSRQCIFRFLLSPIKLQGTKKLDSIIFEKNCLTGEPFKQSPIGTGKKIKLDTGILFRSIGYQGIPIIGAPFNESLGIIPNDKGRVTHNGKVIPQLYTAGWIKRGPSGIIGTNRACSVETIESLLTDIDKLDSDNKKSAATAIYSILESRDIHHINFDEWKRIDTEEIEMGKPKEKPREKFTRVDEMLAITNSVGKKI